MGKNFETGYNSGFFIKVRCPVCKEKIYANAMTCPFCKTDFRNIPYAKMTRWQNSAMIILIILSCIVAFSIYMNDGPIILGIIFGFLFFGLGYIIIQKIQSVKNYFHR